MDVFDSEGALRGSYRWEPDGTQDRPEAAYLEAVDAHGDVYSVVNDPFPHVRRYEVY